VSGAQNALSPLAGRWRGLGGSSKLAFGSLILAAALAAILWPGIFGLGSQKQEPPSAQKPAAAPIQFTEAVAATDRGGPPPQLGSNGKSGAKRLPPPLQIASFVQEVKAPPVASPANNQAANGYGQQVQPVGYPYGPDGYGYRGGPEQGAASGGGGGSLGQQFDGVTVLKPSKAMAMAHPDFTITPGQKIPCLPVEAANSSLGGFYSCRVPDAVRGTTQRRRLIPPGSTVFGQVKKGLDDGEERLAIIFTMIETSGDKFQIPIAAPGADQIGRPGFDGDVNTHFWSTLGYTALYALIDTAQQTAQAAAQSALSKAGSSFTNLNFSAGGGGLASQMLAHKLNRKPVLERDQALPAEITVGQNLDFYDVCIMRMRINPMACPPV
jgi:type IV secretion system protein VirB10